MVDKKVLIGGGAISLCCTCMIAIVGVYFSMSNKPKKVIDASPKTYNKSYNTS